MYHHIDPIWRSEKDDFATTRLFLVHARSAFRDEGIVIENNMPFSDGNSVFLFNGELRGVRIKADGRIGAEKIYQYICRFDKGSLGSAAQKGVDIIVMRSRYIRAMNFFLAERDKVHVCSWFGEDPEYFQLRQAQKENTTVICSAPLVGFTTHWDKIPNQHIETLLL